MARISWRPLIGSSEPPPPPIGEFWVQENGDKWLKEDDSGFYIQE